MKEDKPSWASDFSLVATALIGIVAAVLICIAFFTYGLPDLEYFEGILKGEEGTTNLLLLMLILIVFFKQ